MAANSVRISAALDDKVSGPMDRIRGKMDALGGKGTAASLFGNVGAKLAAGAVGLVADAASQLIGKLGDAQAAFREDEASQARLRASLAANVPAYTGNTDAIEKVLASRMRLGFSDDEQRASLAQLVTRTKDASKAMEIQATAMDLARLRGISLESATNLLGKAYSGNIGALARAGIAVDKNATATQALAAVQKAAKGQAEAFANTSEGRVAASQIRVEDAMERVGLVVAKVSDVAIPILADAFVTVLKVVGDVVASVQRFIGENKGLFDILGKIAGLVGTVLVAAFQQLALVVSTAFNIVSTVIGGVFDIVRGVVSGIIGTIRNVMGVAAEIPGPWQDGARAIKASLDGMQANVESFGRSTVDRMERDGAAIPGAIADPIAAGAGTVLDAAEEGIGDPLAAATAAGASKAVAIARKTPSEMASALRDKREAWQGAIDQLKDDLANKMSTAAEIAGLKAALAGDEIRKGLKSTDPVVRAQARATVDLIQDRLVELGSDSKTWGANVGANFAKGLYLSETAVKRAAAYIAAAAAKNLEVRSPAKEGPLSRGGPEAWGAKIGTSLAAGMVSAVGAVRSGAVALAGAAIPGIGSPSYGGTLRASGSMNQSGGDTLNVTFQSMVPPSAAQVEELERMLTPIVINGFQRRRLMQRVGTA